MLYDGTAGIAAVKAHGGRTFAQDPNEARFGDMPTHAAEVGLDAVLPVTGIAAEIRFFAGRARADADAASETAYRCRVRHAYAPQSLMEEQAAQVESSLWASIRALEEHAHLSGELAETLRRSGKVRSAASLDAHSERTRRRAQKVRSALPHTTRVDRQTHDAADEEDDASSGGGPPSSCSSSDRSGPRSG